jgi:hypothetical protein
MSKPVDDGFLSAHRYPKWHQFDQNCWRQNCASAVHSLFVVSSIIAVLASDSGVAAAGLSPHYNEWLYVTASISLAFFTLALPWSIHMHCVLKAKQPYTRFSLLVHHTLVVVALLVYLLTQYCPHHGALAIFLMEVTNWNYVPHLLLTQLGHKGTCWTINGIVFVLSYTSCRICACSWLVVQLTVDVAHFDPPHDAGWAAAAVTLVCLWGLCYLSWFWFVQDVCPSTHDALKDLFGDEYYHWCCPAPLRGFAVARYRGAMRMRRKSTRGGRRTTTNSSSSLPGQSATHTVSKS